VCRLWAGMGAVIELKVVGEGVEGRGGNDAESVVIMAKRVHWCVCMSACLCVIVSVCL